MDKCSNTGRAVASLKLGRGNNFFVQFVRPPPTLVSFTQKGETVENAKNLKKIARLTLIGALMCPKTSTFGKALKVEIHQFY